MVTNTMSDPPMHSAWCKLTYMVLCCMVPFCTFPGGSIWHHLVQSQAMQLRSIASYELGYHVNARALCRLRGATSVPGFYIGVDVVGNHCHWGGVRIRPIIPPPP
ncbi:hypothetical protein B296_00015047 [Ensete ventricosum]|uniref:Uncharacterized protein n=1 Tax=Ensete ventricosum TaxID=4639 RepID=A0A426Y035_ENSVE|nr:hypothetical protein B296_00015047 [Ensete ventricosum]